MPEICYNWSNRELHSKIDESEILEFSDCHQDTISQRIIIMKDELGVFGPQWQ